MFENKGLQIIKGNKEKTCSVENLRKIIEPKIELSGKDNKIVEISEELRNEIANYLHNKFEIKGIEKREELSLYFYGGDLYLNALDSECEVIFSWLIEDEEIINEIEELIS